METSILHHPESSELQDSDDESDPDPTEYELDAFPGHESDTEIPDNCTFSLSGSQEHYPRPGEAIGDLDGFEQEKSSLCKDPWAWFSCGPCFLLAS